MKTFINVFIIVLCFLLLIKAHKLNVPRVLLPYHPKIQVQFLLEVSGGCFHWKSTKPEIVSVNALNPDASGCSEKAIVTSKAKHEGEHTATIFAKNKDISLNCGVTIDVINSIAITTTTKTLFIDASPAKMIVEAFNKEGDRFSALGEIPFDWYFDSEESVRSLRIIPFSQSKYEASQEIQKLEEQNQRGFVVLVDGVVTGSAVLTAKFSGSYFDKIPESSIDLTVIANVVLVPSDDLYLPINSIVKYGAIIIKQNSIEEITLPSKQYSLELTDNSICELNKKTSKVTAMILGQTEIILIDSNMKPKMGLKPQSARIYVVNPDSIQFSISRGGYWYLQKELDYHIYVHLMDSHGNKMYISDNTHFDTQIPMDHFEILKSSKNGSYFYVRAKTTGFTTLVSQFNAMIDDNGDSIPVQTVITGQQDLQIADKIEIKPYLLVFPYQPKQPYTFTLKATGGTGSYKWQSEYVAVAAIDESKGVLKTGELGHTTIRVEDVHNPQHFALAQVFVLEPADVKWGESHLEAEIGQNLILNVRSFGLEPRSKKLMSFTDCRQLDFRYQIADLQVFRINTNYASEIPVEARGCNTVSLKALKSADTKVKVVMDRFSDEQVISAFPPLIVSVKDELLIATGSEIKLVFEGGPRPWVLDSRNYFIEAVPDAKEFVTVSSTVDSYVLKCGSTIADADLYINVGNKKSSTNPLPVVATRKLLLCCSVPERLLLEIKPKAANDKLPSCPSFVHSLYNGYPSNLRLVAFGKCLTSGTTAEKQFDSITALKAKYRVDKTDLLHVSPAKDQPEIDKLYADARPNSKSGIVNVTAFASISSHKLTTSLSLNLVGIPEALPSFLLLWNGKDVKGSVVISGGSGHYWNDDKNGAQYVKSELIVYPQEEIARIDLIPINEGFGKLVLFDLCIDGARLFIDVLVSDVHGIKINGPDLVQIYSHVSINIEVYGKDGHVFPIEIVKLMGLEVDIEHDAARLQADDLLTYLLHGVTVGTSYITAIVKAANGKVIKSPLHQVQVFSPLKLLPEVVTLIPESVFQFEILGGPQPLPDIEFKLNTSNLATVSTNGLIASHKNFGETTVTAFVSTIGNNPHIVTQDTAILRIVSLTGIKIVSSSSKIDVGETFTVRIEGLDNREIPFAFGGADYPLEVFWSLSSKDSSVEYSSLTDLIQEKSMNRFAAKFKALKPSKIVITATVKVHPQSTRHFNTRGHEFSDSIELILQEKIGLSTPEIGLNSVIITPETSFELKSNRKNLEIIYELPESNTLVTLGGPKRNVIYSGFSEGSLPLKIVDFGSIINETAYLTIDVMNVYSIELVVELPNLQLANGPINVLPQGMTVKVKAILKDHRGRRFSAVNNQLRYRPHRFDLTDIKATDGNREFTIYLKQAGETVFSVWDLVNPRLDAFIRLPVGDVLKPDERNFVIGDLVCFNLPFLPSKTILPNWEITNSNIRLLTKHSGHAVVQTVGETIIKAAINPNSGNSTTYSILNIHAPDIIYFKQNHPKFVSNLIGQHYLFAVGFGLKSGLKENVLGCDEKDLAYFEEVEAPFDCSVQFQGDVGISENNFFTVASVFDTNTGTYSCTLHILPGEIDSEKIISMENVHLQIIATWKNQPDLKGAISLPFYSRFVVHNPELMLNNLDDVATVLKISTVSKLKSSMDVQPCHDNILTVKKIKTKDSPGNVHYKVKLNVNSAALWSELNQDCNIKVTNLETKQVEVVPVKIKLYGDATKAAIDAYRYQGLYGLFLKFYDWFVMLVITLFLVASGFLVYYSWNRQNETQFGNISPNKTQYSFQDNGLKPVRSSTPKTIFNESSSSSSHFPRLNTKLESSDDLINRSSSFSNTDSMLFSPRLSTIRNRHYN